jgi:hypothetical protein
MYRYMYICICIRIYTGMYTENRVKENGNFRLFAATVIDDCCFSKGAHLCIIIKINLQEF